MFMPLPDTVPLSYFFVRLPLDSGLTYAWDFGDGNTSSSPLPNHIYAGPGTYAVCLTVSDAAAGCTDTFCDTITVTNATWSGGSFGPQTASLGESSIQELKAYPNPTSGGLNVSYSSVESSDVALRLIDMTGRVLIDENASAREGQNNETLDLSGFPAGSYVLQVVQGSSVDYLRIVKQ
jgi:PKD repeat protein